MKVKRQVTFIHEVEDTRHRIVVLYSDGVNTPGQWAALHEIAYHDEQELYAITGESVLPQGIFSCKVRQYQVLTGA